MGFIVGFMGFILLLNRRCCTASKLMRTSNRGRNGAEKKKLFQMVRQTQSLERQKILSSKATLTVNNLSYSSIGDVW